MLVSLSVPMMAASGHPCTVAQPNQPEVLHSGEQWTGIGTLFTYCVLLVSVPRPEHAAVCLLSQVPSKC